MNTIAAAGSLLMAVTLSLDTAPVLYAQGGERPKYQQPPVEQQQGSQGVGRPAPADAGPSAWNEEEPYVIDPALAGDGAKVWRNKGCDVCHGIGHGKVTGPDLAGVTTRRDPRWLHNWIRNPREMTQADPSALGMVRAYNNIIMPNLELSEEQIAAVLSYIDRESRKKGS